MWITFIYILLLVFLKWQINPDLDSLWFFAGGILGMFILDIAEELMDLKPSPFRSVLFAGGFALVSFFITTSSEKAVAIGMVLSIYLTLILWVNRDLTDKKNLGEWFRILNLNLSEKIQKRWFLVFIIIFIIETFQFLKQF